MTGERIFRDEATALQWCSYSWTRDDVDGLIRATAMCMGLAEDGSAYCERHAAMMGDGS